MRLQEVKGCYGFEPGWVCSSGAVFRMFSTPEERLEGSRAQRVWDEPALQHGEEENWRALCLKGGSKGFASISAHTWGWVLGLLQCVHGLGWRCRALWGNGVLADPVGHPWPNATDTAQVPGSQMNNFPGISGRGAGG